MEAATIETSCQLFEIAEDGSVFDPIGKVNGIAGNWLSFERVAGSDTAHQDIKPLITIW